MSPQFCSGMRTFARIMSRSSWFSVPALISFMGGIVRPSWNLSKAVGEMLPGTSPPTSDEWMKHQAKHSRRPPAKSGLNIMMSGRCVHIPRVRCGSFVTMTSPGWTSPTARIASSIRMPSMFVTPMFRG